MQSIIDFGGFATNRGSNPYWCYVKSTFFRESSYVFFFSFCFLYVFFNRMYRDWYILYLSKLEISENENRKEFSFNERMTWARLLEEELSKKAKENQLRGLNNQSSFCPNEQNEKINTRKEVAKAIDMSESTYSRHKFVYDNADEETIKKLDDKALSINKAYTVAPDRIIVSGHQRVRACKELGIKEIKYEMRDFENEDDILRDLIDTNLKQRGIGNPNPIKLGRCIIELERIYNVYNGNHKIKESDNLTPKTQKELIEEFEVTKQQYHDYKKLVKLIPELQDLIQDDKCKLSATTGYKLLAKMSPEEQLEIYSDIGKERISDMTYGQTQDCYTV